MNEKHLHPYWFTVIAIVLPVLIFGQPKFINIGEEKGLSSLKITSLYQDSYGFVWIGTPHGLNRFDGYGCVQYYHLPGDTSSLSSSHISTFAFYEDPDSNLWVATHRGGLNFFDRDKERFTSYRAREGRSNSISMDKLFALEGDSNGGMWIATAGKGINHFDPAKGVFRAWDADEERPDLLLGSTVTVAMEQSRAGWLWVGTNKGACRFDPIRDEFENFPYDPGNSQGLSDWYITKILEDSRGNIWIGTANGLNLWDGDKGFAKYFFNAPPNKNMTGNNYVLDILENEDGTLWLGTVGGLILFNPKDGAYEWVLPDLGAPYSILRGTVNAIMKSRDGNIWFGTDNGISILNTSGSKLAHASFLNVQKSFREIAWNEGINAVQEVGAAFWMATQRGIYRYDDAQQLQAVTEGNFSSLFYDPEEGLVYGGTVGDGFYVFDADEMAVVYHAVKSKKGSTQSSEEVKGNRLNSFAKDHRGNIWIATDASLNRYNPANRQIRKFQDTDKDNPNPSSNTNQCLLVDRKGNLWAASMGGLSRLSRKELSRAFDASHLNFENFLYRPDSPSHISNDGVFCLMESNDGKIWAGTEAGLNRFDPLTGEWQWFFKGEGLPGNEVVALVEDQNGDIWAGTAHDGLARFDYNSGRFLHFSKKDGLNASSFRPNSGLCSKNGFVVLGGRSGMAGFHPDSLLYDTIKPSPIYFTDFRIFNKPVAIGEGESPLTLPIYKANHIEVQSAQKVISFQFTALNFINPERQAYRFWLTPFHDGWQYNGNKREATFTNLDPGVYNLRVETTGNGYDWTGASIRLHILPPWFRTWWAYTLWIALLAGAVYWLYQFQLNRRLAEAEALRFKELDSAKSRLYTNITHEFRTPLTIILGMAEQVKEAPENWFNEGLNLIHRNGRQLLHLVNQLLDLSKLEAGHIPLRLEQADVVNHLKYLTESFHSYADGRDIRLHFLTELKSFTMDFDGEKLRKVVSNLLSNAIKFTPEGGDIYVQLAVEPARESLGHLVLTVKDNGEGISSEHLPYIFDRFYQAQSYPASPKGGQYAPGNISGWYSDKTSSLGGGPGGTGIGLALAKELATLMEGTIAVESEAGAGTKFTVRLPVTRQAPKATPFSDPSPPTVEPGIFISGSTTPYTSQFEFTSGWEERDNPLLLLIEDNADVATYLTSFLSGNYLVALAPDGQKGIDMAIELVPDLIISDVMMPGKDGFEVCTTVKSDERTCHIPVILLTAKAGEKSRIEGLGQGADAYIAKPFNRKEVMVRIEKLIDGRRRIQEQYVKKGYLRTTTGAPPTRLDDIFLEKIARIIEENLSDENFGLPELCRQVAMSRSQLFRKLKALSGKSTTHFIRSIRLEKAREFLETTNLTVSEIAFQTGFGNPNYFSRVFRKEFGMAPSEVRKEE